MTLDRAFHRLLHDADSRAALRSGDVASFGLDEEDSAALATIDLAHLDRAAAVVRDSVFTRSHRGTGTLLDLFPRTIQAWCDVVPGAALDALATAFVASSAYDAHRVLPTARGAISLEEAFFRFCDERAIGDASVRLFEVAHAIVRALVVTPEPTFTLPPFVRRAPRGHFALVGEGPTLIAALDRRFVTGPLSPFLAALLDDRAPLDVVAAHHAVSTRDALASDAELRRIGLL